MGKAILRFGDIEVISIRLLADLEPSKSLKAASKMRFTDRADRIIQKLNSMGSLSDYGGRLLGAFERAKELYPKRNLIAHNPMMLDLYLNKDGSEHFVEHTITSIRDKDESMDLADLTEFVGEVDDLAAEAWFCYCNEIETSDDMWGERDAGDRSR